MAGSKIRDLERNEGNALGWGASWNLLTHSTRWGLGQVTIGSLHYKINFIIKGSTKRINLIDD